MVTYHEKELTKGPYRRGISLRPPLVLYINSDLSINQDNPTIPFTFTSNTAHTLRHKRLSAARCDMFPAHLLCFWPTFSGQLHRDDVSDAMHSSSCCVSNLLFSFPFSFLYFFYFYIKFYSYFFHFLSLLYHFLWGFYIKFYPNHALNLSIFLNLFKYA